MVTLFKCFTVGLLICMDFVRCLAVSEAHRITISSVRGGDQSFIGEGEGNLVSGSETKQRRQKDGQRAKRTGIRQEISFERKQPRCQQRLKQMRAGSRKLPTQLVSMVEEGETATFTCHYCGDEHTKFVSMVWHHLKRDKVSGRYSLEEVEPDMHDDDSINRVTIGADHLLIIKKATKDDAGTYFCRDYSKSDSLVRKSMRQIDITRLITDKRTFRFLYHFDVLLPSELETREISRTPGNQARSPAVPHLLGNLNLMIDTSWEKWSPCSTCGRVGERKRLGVCYVKKANKNRDSQTWYVNVVMTSFPAGVPCRSSLFQGHQIKPRPNEIEVEACEVKCIKGLGIKTGSAKTMSVEGIETSISFGPSKEDESAYEKRKSIAVDEGSRVNLNCSGVPVDWTVVWTNNSRVIDFNISNERVTIHANNILEIYPVTVYDAATYHCLSHNEVKVKVKMTVVPSMKVDTVTWLYAYYVSLTYPADIVLFVILMVIKHRHRRAGRHFNKAQLQEIESCSSQSSDRDSGSSSISSYDSHQTLCE